MIDLPSDWDLISFEDLGQWFGGGTPNKATLRYWTNGSVPWLSPKDMGRDVLTRAQDHIHPSAVGETSVRLVPAGSVVVVVRSGILERTLPVALVPFETTLNQDMKAVVPRHGIMPEWIAWGLRAGGVKLLERVRKSGTTVASVEMRKFFAQRLPVPPIDDQRRIIAALEDHLDRVSAATRGLARVEDLAMVLDSSTIAQAISATGRLGAKAASTWGSETVEIPGGWTMTTIGDVAELIEYGTSTKTVAECEADSVPVLRMGNIQSGVIDYSSLKYLPASHPDFPRLLLQAGDLLFNRTNSAELVGKSAIFDGSIDRASFASYLIRVRLSSSANPHWVNFVINSGYGRAYIRSVVTQQVGQANVNGTKLKRFPLPLPPRDQQDQLVEVLLSRRGASDRLRDSVRLARRRSGALRHQLLVAAFSGHLNPSVREEGECGGD